MAETAVHRSQSGISFSTDQFYGSIRRAPTSNIYPASGYDELDDITRETSLLKHTYIMNDIFYRECERLKTFDHWPYEWLDKHQLAQTGMFFTGEGDKVKCYFCEVEIGRWEREDEPVSEHLRWSPNCPLLRRRTTNNEALNPAALDRVLPPVSYDICGANDGIEVHRNSYPEGTIPASRFATSTAVNTMSQSSDCTSAMGSGPTYFPEYPEYAIEAARVRSFADWPLHMKQKPDQLAEAGFFYTGVGDRVKCFSCGGGLKDWDSSDEPWEQHALWLSKCRYLKLIKGQNYIDSILAKKKAQDQAQALACAAVAQKEQVEKSAAQIEPVTVASTPMAMAIKALATEANQTTTSVGCTANLNCDAVPATPAVAVAAAAAPATLCEKLNAVHSDAIRAACSMTEKKTHTSIPEEKLCKICYANEYNTAFLPCGHVVACAKCASSVTKCPLCRKPFTDVMRVYFS